MKRKRRFSVENKQLRSLSLAIGPFTFLVPKVHRYLGS